jgi:hypothetical protein
LRSTGFYYRDRKQPKEPPQTNRSKGAIVDPIRLATCLDRSVAASGASALTLLQALLGSKRLPPAKRLPLVERAGVGRIIVVSEGSS